MTKQTRNRALWNLADQGLSSLSNAALAIVIARAVSPGKFGEFAVVFALYGFLLGLAKSLIGTPYVLATSGGDGVREGRWSVWLTCLLGWVLMVLIGGTGLLVGGSLGAVLVVFGAGMPVLLLQDFWRTVLIARGRPAGAALNGAVWILVAVAGFWCCHRMNWDGSWHLSAAWVTGGGVGALFGLWQLGLTPERAGAWSMVRRDWGVTKWLSREYMAVLGAQQAMWFLIPLVAGAAAVGAVRGGLTLLGPLGTLSMAANTFLLTELVRDGTPKVEYARRTAMTIMGALCLLCTVWGLFIGMIMPNDWGVALLGDTWATANGTIIPLTLFFVALCAGNGPLVVMRAFEETKRTFRVSVAFGLATIVFSVAGAIWGAGEGAAWGRGLSALVFVPVWLLVLSGSLRGRE